jgi:hypothetical protein
MYIMPIQNIFSVGMRSNIIFKDIAFNMLYTNGVQDYMRLSMMLCEDENVLLILNRKKRLSHHGGIKFCDYK